MKIEKLKEKKLPEVVKKSVQIIRDTHLNEKQKKSQKADNQNIKKYSFKSSVKGLRPSAESRAPNLERPKSYFAMAPNQSWSKCYSVHMGICDMVVKV